MTWSLDQFTSKDVVFVGAGKGRALEGIREFLTCHASLASFTAVDKQAGEKPLDFLLAYDTAKTVFIKNEGIPGREMPVPYITPMQIFFELARANNLTLVGITGTKGKSTTTSLTAHILQAAGKPAVLAGNIGVSPFKALDEATPETVFVLELSSYQLSDLKISPHISACINLYNDHSDWHGSIDQYWEDKHNIMRFAAADDVFIYNPAFPALQEWVNGAVCRTIPINPQDPLSLEGAQLFGEHNRLNALVAREIARQFDVDDSVIVEAIKSYQPLSHRMEIVATVHGRTYVDDAIGMTPESTMASLTAIRENIGPIGCLLLGGQDRNYDFSALMEQVAADKIPHLVLFPETTDKMKAALPSNYQPQIFETTSMEEAVSFAARHSPDGSVVLLSTAAPSYLLWKDFEDKGDQFKAAVNSLA